MLHAADPAGILIPEDLFMHVFYRPKYSAMTFILSA